MPSDEEFQLLVDYLGGRDVAGGKMKSQTLWRTPNTGADNSSGFTALPSGYRNGGVVGTYAFIKLGSDGSFWSSTDNNGEVNGRHLGCNYSNVYRNGSSFKEGGLSVRCVKD